MRILLVDDEARGRGAIAEFLQEQLGHQVTQADGAQEALSLFLTEAFPLVLAAVHMPGLSGLDLVKSLREMPQRWGVGIILFTDVPDTQTAIEALRVGADDYLLKPLNLEELDQAINRVCALRLAWQAAAQQKDLMAGEAPELSPSETPAASLQDTLLDVPGIGRIGIFSDALRAVVTMTRRLHEDRAIPVLIEGETGTGKEIIAHLIHHGNQVNPAPFVSINCSAISPSLFESELFGYEGGAFTGARRSGIMGKLELAQGGTLFLDEIGDMPLDMQPKLLRAIQEKEIYRVGGLKKIPLDVRIIAATNRDLKALVNEGRFRQDLYFRLHVGWIQVPPLRQQKEAVIPFAQMFQNQYAQLRKRRFRFIHESARAILESYSWPGNVRELQNTIDRVVLLYDDIELRPEHLSFLSQSDGSPLEPGAVEVKLGHLALPPNGLDLTSLETEIVRKALHRFSGNRTKTAQYLGLTRSALRSRLNKVH